MAEAALGPPRRRVALTRWWLRLTAVLGFAGVGFHATACRATWAAGGTGGRTCSTARPSRRPPASPAWRWPVSPRSACWRTIPMTERYPGYDVLAKRDTLSWNEPTRRVIDKRLAVPPEPRFFNAAEWATLVGALRPHRAAADGPAARAARRPMSTRRCSTNTSDGYRFADCRRRARPGSAAWRRSTRRRSGAHGAASTSCRGRTGCAAQQMQRGELEGPALGRHAVGRCSSSNACCTTSCTPITPTRPPGTRSAGAAPPARAATCAWAGPARPLGGGRGQARRGGASAEGERSCRLIPSAI